MTTGSTLHGKSESHHLGGPGFVPGNCPTFGGNPINMDRRPTNLSGSNTRGERDYDLYDVGRSPGNPTSTRCGLLFVHTAECTPFANAVLPIK